MVSLSWRKKRRINIMMTVMIEVMLQYGARFFIVSMLCGGREEWVEEWKKG
jgi:hypothetical protein